MAHRAMVIHHYDARKWPLLKRFRFWLVREQVSIDCGYSRCDVKAAIWFKIFDGKIYVTKEWIQK